jgi:hypothetical protein
VVGCCECGDEPSGSCATELVNWWPVFDSLFKYYIIIQFVSQRKHFFTKNRVVNVFKEVISVDSGIIQNP